MPAIHEHLEKMHRFLEETDKIEPALRTVISDRRAQTNLLIGVGDEDRRAIQERLERIQSHPEITSSFGWKRKALTYGLDVVAKDHIPMFVEATRRWLEIFEHLEDVARRTKDPNFRAMAERIRKHADAARETLRFFEENPHAYKEYLEEVERMRRAARALDEFEEL